MTSYKYVDSTLSVVHVIDADGISRSSMLASSVPDGADILQPDFEAAPVATCSPWQIRKALNITGLRQTVEDAVAASGDITLQDGWEFATEFRSDDDFVIAMGAGVGKTADETRALIEMASSL